MCSRRDIMCGASKARTAPSSIAPPIRPATRAISSSAPRARSSTSCAFRWAIWRSATCGRWRPNSICPWPTSRTARTSASCPTANYARVVEACGRMRRVPGEIVDLEGRVLGRHDGVIHFTVGQRKGLGLSGNERAALCGQARCVGARVVVGPREALRIRMIALRDVNWLCRSLPPVRMRGQGALDAAARRRARDAVRRRRRVRRTPGQRRSRGARPGLRVLRKRRHARAGRRLDRARRAGARRGLGARFSQDRYFFPAFRLEAFLAGFFATVFFFFLAAGFFADFFFERTALRSASLDACDAVGRPQACRRPVM